MKRVWILFFCGFLTIGIALAQEVNVTAKAWPTKVTVGDEIELFVIIDRPTSFSVTPPSPETPLSPFEIKKIEPMPSQPKNGRLMETYKWTLTVFELGELKIPPVNIELNDARGNRVLATTQALPIKVVAVANHPKEKDDIKPIKGPVSLNTQLIKVWILGGIAALLAIALTVKIILRRRKKALDDESLKSAHERARLELERLRAKGYLADKKTKEYYSELADILRRYLDRRFELETLELTTPETLVALKVKDLDRPIMEKIKLLLENADLVKFAKFEPARSLAGILEQDLLTIIDTTKPVETVDTEIKK